MAELLRNPKIMAKAKENLLNQIENEKPMEEKDVIRLPYLQLIIKETMRLHIPSPFLLPHRAEMDTGICGYTVPKHAQVLVNSWALARDPKYWENPAEFLPERFLKTEVDFRATNFYLLAFGSRRRICPGLNLGVRMICLLLASSIYNFDWIPPYGLQPKDVDMSDKFGATLQKVSPVLAIPQTS